MARRYGRKFSRFSRRRYGRRHAAAASKIGRAWRIRRRRRTGLLTRTALSNRRQIRVIKKSIETKVLEGTVASLANQWQSGLCCNDGMVVSASGNWLDVQSPAPYPTGTFACDLLAGLTQGPGAADRIGQWIQMKSLTLKYCLSADDRTKDSFYGIMLVLDRQPAVGGVTLSQVLKRQTAQPFSGNDYMLAFQNLDNTGKDGRYKILYHKKHRLACQENMIGGVAVPPIQTVGIVAATNTWGDVSRATYTPQFPVTTASGGKNQIYGSITLKTPYKLNYGVRDVSTQTFNQTILLMAYQCNRFDGQTPSNGGPQTTLQWNGRFRFKDA